MKYAYFFIIALLFFGLSSCKGSKQKTPHNSGSPPTKITKGTNRVYVKILRVEKQEITYCSASVLRLEGSGGSVRPIAKDEKIRLVVSKQFRDLYLKNNMNLDNYFQVNKKLTLSIKPATKSSKDSDQNANKDWKVVELHY